MSEGIQSSPRKISDRPLAQPVFCFKRALPDLEERRGLIALRGSLPRGGLIETYFTRLDQALMLWGGVTAMIFGMAQFSGWDWRMQALSASVLTLSATLLTVGLTWHWATVKRARWVIGVWSALMVGAIALTDYGIVAGNGAILRHLCTGWLSVCAVGYFATGIGMESRALRYVTLVHLCTVPLARILLPWQFLLTGSVLTLSLWLLGTLQWDHR